MVLETCTLIVRLVAQIRLRSNAGDFLPHDARDLAAQISSALQNSATMELTMTDPARLILVLLPIAQLLEVPHSLLEGAPS